MNGRWRRGVRLLRPRFELGVIVALVATQFALKPLPLIGAGAPATVLPRVVTAAVLPAAAATVRTAAPPVPLKEVAPPHPLGVPTPSPVSPAAPAGIRFLWDLPGSGVAPQAPVVALTFDDGPDPRYTAPILDILGRYGAPATFFMVGRLAAAHPELVLQVASAGHAVGGHTWNHVDLRTLPDAAYPGEVDNTDGLLSTITNQPIRCVRPPRGDTDARVTTLLAARGMANIIWSVDPTDWGQPGPQVIAQRTLAAAVPGAILLLHDGGGDRSQTVAALPLILDGLRARGLTPVPMCR